MVDPSLFQLMKMSVPASPCRHGLDLVLIQSTGCWTTTAWLCSKGGCLRRAGGAESTGAKMATKLTSWALAQTRRALKGGPSPLIEFEDASASQHCRPMSSQQCDDTRKPAAGTQTCPGRRGPRRRVVWTGITGLLVAATRRMPATIQPGDPVAQLMPNGKLWKPTL